MKNLYFSLLVSTAFLVINTQVNAQITLTKDDLMIPGMMLDEYVDTTTKTLSFGNVGSGQSWDYSTLTEDTIWNSDIKQPQGLAKSNLFPTATAAIERFDINTQYYQNTNTESIFLGSVVAVPNLDTMVFKHNYSYIKFPATLGSTISETGDPFFFFKNAAGGIDPDGPGPHPTVDSIATKTIDLFEAVIDASGSVSTPIHTYGESLRQYSKSTTIDSAYMHAGGKWQPMSSLLASFFMTPLVQSDTAFTYAWMVKEGGLPVLVIEFDPANNDQVLIVQWTNFLPQGIENSRKLNFVKVYPNPFNDVIKVSSNKEGEISFTLRDLQGRNITQGKFSGNTQIDAGDLPSGQYLLILENEEGIRDVRRLIAN